MSISTDVYADVAGRVREGCRKSVECWKRGVRLFTDQVDLVARLTRIDLTEPVGRYFEFVQRAVDLNREVATRWAELVTAWSGSVREQAEKVGGVVTDQVDAVAELAKTGAPKAEELAHRQAALAEEAAKEQEREIKRPSGPPPGRRGRPPGRGRGANQVRDVRPVGRAGHAEDRHC